MDVELSPELDELRAAVRRFVGREMEPLARQMDATGEAPAEVVTRLRDGGYLGMRLAEADGGGGVGLFAYCLTLEELSRSHRYFTLVLDYSSGLTPGAIARHGTPEQRAKYLPGLISGATRTAFALTEPEAGSDSAAIRTRAVRAPGGWRIDGRKHFISGGGSADFIMLMAVTDPEKRARGGITAFLVDRGTPGFTVTREEETIGSIVRLAELTFENCFVPDAAVLGTVGGGFPIAMASLTDGRLGVSCSCIGAADRLLEMAVAHARDRSTFGKPLAERQAIQWMLADSAIELRAARALAYDTLRQVEAGRDVGTAASMCKVFCSEMVGRVADRVVQIHGGMGLVRSWPVERFYRDIRHYRVGEGASEIQRMLIARGLLRDAGGRA
jgi:acyl-CoA dehydrogenase